MSVPGLLPKKLRTDFHAPVKILLNLTGSSVCTPENMVSSSLAMFLSESSLSCIPLSLEGTSVSLSVALVVVSLFDCSGLFGLGDTFSLEAFHLVSIVLRT